MHLCRTLLILGSLLMVPLSAICCQSEAEEKMICAKNEALAGVLKRKFDEHGIRIEDLSTYRFGVINQNSRDWFERGNGDTGVAEYERFCFGRLADGLRGSKEAELLTADDLTKERVIQIAGLALARKNVEHYEQWLGKGAVDVLLKGVATHEE